MISGPIDKRLRECEVGDDALTARAAELLRAIPEPAPLPESVRRRTLRALGASGRNGRGVHLSTLQWAVLSVLLVSTAAAASKRIWFPTFFHRKAAFVERAADAVVVDPLPASRVASEPGPRALEEPSSPKAVGQASSRAR